MGSAYRPWRCSTLSAAVAILVLLGVPSVQAQVPQNAEPAAAGASPPPVADPCNGAGTCYFGGTFVAEVTRVTPSRPSAGPVNATVVYRVDVRFRNVSTKPIVLAHVADSARIVDNNGNRYWYWDPKANITGIGLVGNNAVDPTFVLRPNESRNATFEQRFVYDSRQKVPGNSFTFDLEIDEIAPLSNQQVRVARKNAVVLRNLSARSGG